MISKQTIKFLADLSANNNKEWFHENKDSYDAAKNNVESFAGTLIEKILKLNKDLSGLEPKDCIFRIFRDVRFSKNKEPYKTHFGVVISEGGRKSNLAGFYIQIDPSQSFIAGGCWMPEGADLKKIRQEIDYNFQRFSKILNSLNFKREFGELEDNRLKTVPQGYDKDNPAIDLLRLKSFVVVKQLPKKLITSDDLVSECVKSYKTMLPLIDFLNAPLKD
jgi:uncharacterized protein (TIGR02453 family)